MAKLVKIKVGTLDFVVTDKNLQSKINALFAGTLKKDATTGVVSTDNVAEDVANYWLPKYSDKEQLDALSQLSIVNLKGILNPATIVISTYTAEEATAYNTENSLNPGDPGYVEEGDPKEYATTADEALDTIQNPAKGDVYLVAQATATGGSAYTEYVYISKGGSPEVFDWEVLGTLTTDVDVSGKADTAQVKKVFDAFKVTLDPDGPAEVHYTAEEIAEAQEGDDAYGKTTSDVKNADVLEYILEIPKVGLVGNTDELYEADDPEVIAGLAQVGDVKNPAKQIKVINA